MGSKSARQIVSDLLAAGVDAAMARTLSSAAMLRGEAAKKFINENDLASFEISELSQKRLFDLTYSVEEQSARGVCQRASVKYGPCDWDKLHIAIRELIVDLKYRGDYTPASRGFIQPLIVNNDLSGLAKAMADRKNWSNVPTDRFQRRKSFMEAAVKASP